MIALAFFASIALLFAALLAYETPRGAQPLGLWRWLTHGNWPAKVGAGLLILGVGALLRYALLNLQVAPAAKLASGLVAAFVLGGASFALRASVQRALHLALAGAAFATLYLTAYSAYALFGYVDSMQALAAMAMVSIAAGVFATQAHALSVAVLALAGAFVAPAFAFGAPSPAAVYGYYVAASAFALLLVRARGWRALIHLSFLFTLAGGLFFGWTRAYYQPAYYATMQPLLLVLVALHVAMPVAESRALAARWQVHADLAYRALLPLVAAALTLAIAPRIDIEGSLGLAALAAIWVVAAFVLRALRRPGAAVHGAIGALLLAAALLLALRDVPWTLVALGAAVVLLAAAPRLGFGREAQEFVCFAIGALATLHVFGSVLDGTAGAVFANRNFAERLAAAALLGAAGSIARRRALDYANVFSVAAIAWALLALVAELLRLNLEALPQYVFAAVCGAALAYALLYARAGVRAGVVAVLLALLLATATWAAWSAELNWLRVGVVAAPLTAAALAWATARRAEPLDATTALALAALPLLAAPWLIALEAALAPRSAYFVAAGLIAATFAAQVLARLANARSASWDETVVPVAAALAALAIAASTLVRIERTLWAVLVEGGGLAVLGAATASALARERPHARALGALLVAGIALVTQATLLRLFGPERAVLTVLDLVRMKLPAVVSLTWAVAGGGLAAWSAHVRSRATWLAGASLLVAAAVKLVLFDFGSLGELGNIVALIAAGLVFLCVAWLAPFPPRDEREPASG